MANHAGNDADEDLTARYFSGGAPPQPFHVIIPPEPESIITERLCLRSMRPEHAEGLFALRSGIEQLEFDPRFTPDADIEQTKSWMASKVFAEPPLAEGRRYQFVITRRDDPTERIIGSIGINRVAPLPNIGYGLTPDMWGKGYATEALKGLLRQWWALPREEEEEEEEMLANGDSGTRGAEEDGKITSREKEKMFANCNKANVASLKVLTKAGFEVYRELVFDDGTCLCLSVAAE